MDDSLIVLILKFIVSFPLQKIEFYGNIPDYSQRKNDAWQGYNSPIAIRSARGDLLR